MQDLMTGLQAVFDNYRAVQVAHGQYLDTGAVSEVERLAFERAILYRTHPARCYEINS